MLRPLKPVERQQLYAMARELLVGAPEIPDSEWIERIKDRLAAQWCACPLPHHLVAAMRAVERELQRGGFTRRLTAQVAAPPPPAPLRELTQNEAVTALQLVMQRVLHRLDASPIRSMPDLQVRR